MHRRTWLPLLILLTTGVGRALADRPSEEEIGEIQVYLTVGEALHEIFEDVAGVDTVVAVLEEADHEILRDRLGTGVPADTVVVYKPRSAEGTCLGYAMVAEEIGKYRPITFMVGTSPEGKVQDVEVLVYRESRGGEVRRARFLRQYRGKSDDDPIRSHRDILNVAGATMSVNAMNRGVKRALVTLSVLAEKGAL